jgi:hypothetical protein
MLAEVAGSNPAGVVRWYTRSKCWIIWSGWWLFCLFRQLEYFFLFFPFLFLFLVNCSLPLAIIYTCGRRSIKSAKDNSGIKGQHIRPRQFFAIMAL